MSDRISQLRIDFDRELASIDADRDATALRDRWIGRKNGLVTSEMKTLGKLSPEERKTVGAELNELRDYVKSAIEGLQTDFAAKREIGQLRQERIDVTLPGRRIGGGHLHPITLLRHKV